MFLYVSIHSFTAFILNTYAVFLTLKCKRNAFRLLWQEDDELISDKATVFRQVCQTLPLPDKHVPPRKTHGTDWELCASFLIG